MIHRKPFIAACALALLSIPAVAAAPAVSAPAWTVDKASSTLGFEGVGDGSPFAGKFGSWDAAIHFDPADLAGSSAEVTVQTGSAATGDPSRDEPLPSPQWFSTDAFPTATFTTTAIKSTGPNAYLAEGNLSIRGISKAVQLPFTLTIAGDKATMDGSLTIDRSLWEIGAGAWQDHSVDPNVTVKVKLSATKAG